MSKVPEIDYRTKVGSTAWDKNHDEETKRTSAWRRLHMLLPHEEVKKRASPDQSSAELAEVVKQVEADRNK